MKKWMYNAMLIAFAAIFLISGIFLVSYLIKSGQEADNYDKLGQIKDEAPTVPRPSIDENGDVIPPDTPPVLVDVIDPETGETVKVLEQFKDLYLQNNDLVGWISVPGTDIDYPVVQRKETIDYYLRRDYYGKYDSHGCIYVREVCDVNTPSDNVTIYGHRMKDNTMFGQLARYEKKSYWQENQYIYFDTLTEFHTYQIISVFTTTASVGEGFQYHLFVDALAPEDMQKYLANCKANAIYDTGLTAEYGDKLITLSTCEYTHENGRLVIVAKRIQ